MSLEDQPCAAAERELAVALECYIQAMAKVPIAGEIARAFELPDSTGVARRLTEMVSQGRLVILFYRGDW